MSVPSWPPGCRVVEGAREVDGDRTALVAVVPACHRGRCHAVGLGCPDGGVVATRRAPDRTDTGPGAGPAGRLRPVHRGGTTRLRDRDRAFSAGPARRRG